MLPPVFSKLILCLVYQYSELVDTDLCVNLQRMSFKHAGGANETI